MMTEHQWDRLERMVRLLGKRDRRQERESQEQLKKLLALNEKNRLESTTANIRKKLLDTKSAYEDRFAANEERFAKLAESMAKLAESQANTDRHLNELIEVVRHHNKRSSRSKFKPRRS